MKDQLDFSSTPLLLAGHSHLYSMLGYEKTTDGFAATSEFRVDDVPGTKGLRVCHGAWPRADDYWDRLHALGRSDEPFAVGLSFRGNDHLARFLLRPSRPIDFFSSHFPDLPVDGEAELVPEALVDASFSSLYEPLRIIIRNLAACDRRVILFATPPPKPDEDFLRQSIINEVYFKQICDSRHIASEDIAFTALPVRLKLWGILQDISKALAVAEGAEYLPAPSATLNDDGSLRRQYWAPDCTHANPAFGKAVLEQVLAHLRAPEA